MTLNDVLTKQNFITRLILLNGDKELSKELKVKIMRIRMAYNKIKKQFDEEAKEFGNLLMSDELKNLINKPSKTSEESLRFGELSNKYNLEYTEYLIQKGEEEVSNIDDNFTMDEFEEIIDINSGNDIEIKGRKMKAADFLGLFSEVFVLE